MLVRLQKYIADQGICSRRKAERLIIDGKVKVNGEIVSEMGVKVDTEIDKIVVDTADVENFEFSQKGDRGKIYVVLNKPVDYICSNDNSQGQTVLDLLVPDNYWKGRKEIMHRVYSVGRLDKDSEGLVLLTNDGDLANELTHPKFEHEKEYEVTITDKLSRDVIKVLESGMDIGGGEMVGGIEIKKTFNKGRRQIVTVVLKEGKNRQIRKMFGRLGYKVISLRRTRIKKLKLGTLPIGRWRFVSKDKIV